jgi:hypothetical protein
MKNRILQVAAMGYCLFLFAGCAMTGPQLPIINPPRIDQKEAKEILISRYSELIVKSNRIGFEYATAICRRLQNGEIALEGSSSSENGRYSLFMFKDNEPAGPSGGAYSIIAFSFDPGAELIRTCNPDGLCDVYVKNGAALFGRTTVGGGAEPRVNNSGIDIKFIQDRSFSYDLLFSYGNRHKREGDELIAIFLSAFPFLYYQ